MNPPLTFALSTAPADAEIEELRQSLIRYNSTYTGPLEYTPILLTLRDAAGKLMGGLSGHIYYTWLYVDWLWLDESLRGQRHGTALLKKAEEEAMQRGCLHVWLDTFDFQARGFYEKQGYRVFGHLEDYPPGHHRYYLRKELKQP